MTLRKQGWDDDRLVGHYKRFDFEAVMALLWIEYRGEWKLVHSGLMKRFDISLDQARAATESERKCWDKDFQNFN